MIHRLAREEEESLTSQSSAEDSSVNESLEKLDLTSSGSAMSTVYGSESGNSAAGSGKRSSSRSPSRRTSSNLSLPFHRRSSSRGAAEDDQRHKQQQHNKHEDHLARWLTTGNVIYKSVGLGLMDLVVGFEIVRLAKEKGLGSHIQGFS